MPIEMNDIKDSLVAENLKLIAGAGSHAMATIYQASAAGFQRREGLLDAAMAKQLEDIRFSDADAARATERLVGHPTAESSASMAGGLANSLALAKMVFSQPPTGWTPYPGAPGATLGGGGGT